MKTFDCTMCGKTYAKKGINPKSRWCSRVCKAKWQSVYNRGIHHPRWLKNVVRSKVCKYCGKTFTNDKRNNITTFQKMKFCSKKCADSGGLRYSGKDHSNWTGRKDALARLRSHPKYTHWTRTVLKRDNYTCQFCGKRGGNMHAHHLKSFADYPELRFDLDNGKTLCVKCHRTTYKFYHKPHKTRLAHKGVNSGKLPCGQSRAEPSSEVMKEGVEVSLEITDISAPLTKPVRRDDPSLLAIVGSRE